MYRLGQMRRGQLSGSNNGIISGTLNFAQAWDLDATGNWSQFWENDSGSGWNLQQSRTANLFNEITAIAGGGWAQPAYDAAGNMVAMPQPASPATSYSAIYDAWNRMISVSNGGLIVQRNAYDGLKRRAAKLVSGALRHYFYSASWQPLEERLGASSMADRQFIWGLRYIDGLVLRDQGTERLYALQDPNWNGIAICDAAGEIQERYSYSPYGQPMFCTALFSALATSAYGWETLFAGYRSDSEIGSSIAHHRFLHHSIGTWLVRDPIGFAGRDLNLYRYVNTSPLDKVDPQGLAVVLAECACRWHSVCVEGYASGEAMIDRYVAMPPATARDACPSGCSLVGTSPLTGDLAALAGLCDGNVACEEDIARIIELIANNNVRPNITWFGLAHLFPNVCGSHCARWTTAWSDKYCRMPSIHGTTIRLCTVGVRYPRPGGPEHSITIVRNSETGACMAIDNGAYGGDDHVFDPDELIFDDDTPFETLVDFLEAMRNCGCNRYGSWTAHP